MGNETEYTRMNKPMLLRERLRDIDKNLRLKHDCRFIKYLIVPNGTVMAPSNPFCKIWCMHKNGTRTTAWPFGTQLTWIGGNHFDRQISVKLGPAPLQYSSPRTSVAATTPSSSTSDAASPTSRTSAVAF